MRLASILLALTLACSTSSPNGGAAAGREAVAERTAPSRIDAGRLITHARVLSADSMEGRRTATPGNERARRYLAAEMQRIGLAPVGGSHRHPFTFSARGEEIEGVNFVGMVRGTATPERYIVVTAHYDHLGIGRAVDGDSLYNGADDNASGTGGLLAIAEWVRRNPLRHTVLFVAFDAEEQGLRGARAFVAGPPVPRESIVLNINMDMVGRNDRNELYAAGTHHYPFLRPYVERVAARAPITLRIGHDTPVPAPIDDWTTQSDHGAFHAARIPFLYFGVEDHPDYHRPSDTFDRLQPYFYWKAIDTVLDFLIEVDEIGARG
ncbi:MAG TPA: M28 family peptidase [Gemmatimonadaceae bacterium]|nr:M28 family peptidase [Gemmatimonadaceae bacterium]